MSSRPTESKIGIPAIIASLVHGMAIACVTALLLLVNGSLVLLLLKGFSRSTPEWLQGPSLLQFILFTVPVIMVIAQWMVWDALRNLFSRSRPSVIESESLESTS